MTESPFVIVQTDRALSDGQVRQLGKMHLDVLTRLDTQSLEQAIADLSESLLAFAMEFPTRSAVVYRCLNKPWEAANWQLLRTAPTRRALNRMRADYDHRAHVRWAHDLLKKD